MKRLNLLDSELVMKRAIKITATPIDWESISLSPSSKKAVAIVTSGSIFSIRLVCAEPMNFVAANRLNWPKTNKIQIEAIPDHPPIV